MEEIMKDLELAKLEEEKIAEVNGGTELCDGASETEETLNEKLRMLESGSAAVLREMDSLTLRDFASTGGGVHRYETG